MSFTLRLFILVFILGIANYAWSEPSGKPKSDTELYLSAKSLLDHYQGQKIDLQKAGLYLSTLINRTPNHAPAWLEVARLTLKGGHVVNHEFAGGTRSIAAQAINRSLENDYKNADAYVLLGHINFLNKDYAQGLSHLSFARELGTDNPWLELNTADIHMALREYSKARPYFVSIVQRGPSEPTGHLETYIVALKGLLDIAYQGHETGELQRLAAQIDQYATPDNAWVRGDAGHLLCRSGVFEEGLRLVRKALSTMNYGVGRYNQSFCLYGRWAEMVFRGKPTEVTELAFEEAWSTSKSMRKISTDMTFTYLRHLEPVMMERFRAIIARSKDAGEAG